MDTGFVFCLSIVILFSVLRWWLCVNLICLISLSVTRSLLIQWSRCMKWQKQVSRHCVGHFICDSQAKETKQTPSPAFLCKEKYTSARCIGMWCSSGDVRTRTKFCPSELHWARALAWDFLNSVKFPTWNLQKQRMDGHKNTAVALQPKPQRVAVCSWAGTAHTCTQTWAKPVCSGVST